MIDTEAAEASAPGGGRLPEQRERRPMPWWLQSLLLIVLAGLCLVIFSWASRRQAELAGRVDAHDTAQYLSDVVNVFSCCILTWEFLPIVVPAFLLGGAASAFIPPAFVLRYLGARARPVRAYLVAALSGLALALCSCSVIPLFVSIYRRGAGIGPAFAFLYAGPAISIVPILVTMQVIGWQIGVWRLVAVPIVGIIVGLAMALLFRREGRARADAEATRELKAQVGVEGRVWVLLGIILAVCLFAALVHDWTIRGIVYAVVLPLWAIFLWRAFDRDELGEWMRETLGLFKLVVPILVPLLIIIGAASTFVDIKLVHSLMGAATDSDTLWRHLQPIVIGCFTGALMYFPELSEVAFAKALLKLQVPPGPCLAILMAGAGVSLPGLFILTRAVGLKKAVLYELLVLVLVFGVCVVFASEVGAYICQCLMQGH